MTYTTYGGEQLRDADAWRRRNRARPALLPVHVDAGAIGPGQPHERCAEAGRRHASHCPALGVRAGRTGSRRRREAAPHQASNVSRREACCASRTRHTTGSAAEVPARARHAQHPVHRGDEDPGPHTLGGVRRCIHQARGAVRVRRHGAIAAQGHRCAPSSVTLRPTSGSHRSPVSSPRTAVNSCTASGVGACTMTSST